MKKVLIRRWSLIAAAAVIVGSMGINKYLASLEEPPEKKPGGQEKPLVNVLLVAADTTLPALSISGRLRSQERIQVFSEATGRLTSGARPFKEGNEFRRGEVLLKLDDRDVRMNLIATRSNFLSLLTQIQANLKLDYPENFDAWASYIEEFNPEEPILPLPETASQQEKNFIVSKNILNQYYAIKSQEEQLAKYTVHAPFTGVVSAANVSRGALVRAGQPVGEFLNTEVYELELGVSVNDITDISIGDMVRVTSSTTDGVFVGKITRIGKSIDPQTQTFKVYAEVRGNELFEGMYVDAQVGRAAFPEAYPVPASLVVDDRYVLTVVNDSMVIKQPVQVVHESNGTRLVKGLDEGQMIISQPMPQARDSMIVEVDGVILNMEE